MGSYVGFKGNKPVIHASKRPSPEKAVTLAENPCICGHDKSHHAQGQIVYCVGDMGKCPCKEFAAVNHPGRLMFHIKQTGVMKGRDFLIWSHALSLPLCLNNFVNEVARFKAEGWTSTHSVTIAVHSDIAVSEEILEFLKKYVVSPVLEEVKK